MEGRRDRAIDRRLVLDWYPFVDGELEALVKTAQPWGCE